MLERLAVPHDFLQGVQTQLLADLLHHPHVQPINLIHDSRWASMLDGWGEAHKQHDVCEFISHMLRMCQILAYSQALGRQDSPRRRGFYDMWMKAYASIPFFCICQLHRVARHRCRGFNHWLTNGTEVWIAFML